MAVKPSAARSAAGKTKESKSPLKAKPEALTADNADERMAAAGVTTNARLFWVHQIESGQGEVVDTGGTLLFRRNEPLPGRPAPKAKKKATKKAGGSKA